MPRSMPLKPTTVRFAEDASRTIQQAADEVGSTFAQFVREAAIMRAVLVSSRRPDDFTKLAAEVGRLARRDE